MNRETTYSHTTRSRRALLRSLAVMLAVLPASMLTAQNGFNMPYSQYGIGISEQPFNMPMASRLGGAMITRSGNNYINPFNPASYGAIERESFVFDMGVNVQSTTLVAGDQKMHDADGNIGYLVFGMPITGWLKLAGGLMPYSQIDYESVVKQTGAGYGTVKNIYDGTGGVSQLFLGAAFNIPAGKSRTLQAGFNVNYLTGNIERAVSQEFQGNDTTFYINKRRHKKTVVSNLTFDFGAQLRQQLGEKYTLGVGLTYKPYRDMTVADEAMIYTYANNGAIVDTVFPARGAEATFDSRLEQASTFGVGLSLERNRRWVVAADANFGSWNGMRYTEDPEHAILGSDAMRYGPFSRYSLGIERIGNMDASTYWGRIGWSLGAHIEQGAMHLTLNGADHRIDSWGIGAGVSMPMRKGRSLLTLSVAYSSMGKSDLLRSDCLTIGIAVSSCERWFAKRKYN